MMKHFRSYLYLILLFVSFGSFASDKADFFRAVEIDAANVVGSLLASGFDPNQRDDKGQTGLYLALRGESMAVVKALLASPRIDVDLANEQGETPLMMAALRGNLEMAKTLIERGAKIDKAGWTPLHYAASGPSPAMVAFLLDRGAAIEALSPNNTTPLMMAARYGAIDSADLLRQRGADLARRNQRELNAADFAKGAGRDDLAARLMPK